MTYTDPASGPEGGLHAAPRWLPALLFLFVGSGCAALIYEVVWFQLLQLSVGSSAVSLGILLGIFMGGMCLGSLLLPRFISSRHHPLKVYAFLEFGIGLCGVVVLFAVPVLGDAYTRIAGTGQASLILRALVASVCLIPPTLLMGATLPAIARWVEATPSGVSWLGYFYAGNLAGAVAGSVLAGFYLLRVYDMPAATFVAVGMNALVAVLAMLIATRTPYTPAAVVPPETTFATEGSTRLVYVAIALSGLTALGSQVVWARVLALLFGGTVYTFSLILAVFLVGLGIGSFVGAELGRRVANPRVALGWCQLLLCAALGWAAYTTGASMPYWPINPSISTNIAFNFQLDLVRAVWVILPGALLWGASFPLALAAVAERERDPARLVGGVYAANTVGAIVGAVVTSLFLMGTFGSQFAQRVLMSLALLSGLLMIVPIGTEGTARSRARAWVTAVIAALLATFLARGVPPLPGILVAYGRYAATWIGQNEIIYVGEGVTASVAVSRTPTGTLNYHNAGKVQASSEPQDMRLQRMLGHITTLVPLNPSKVLVIGCGAGVTAGAVSIDPLVKDQTIAEIEPLVPRVVSTYFGEHNFNVVKNPKVTVHLDDARHYLLTTDEKFDAITSDPLDPWVKGAATLYTREFFREVRDHLNPGGVVTLFVQLYESNEAAVKSEIATFLEAFPNGAVFANTINGQGYDLVLFGQLEAGSIDVDRVQARLSDPANEAVRRSLSEVGINSAVDLFGTYAGRTSDMSGWLKDGMINTDRNLRLQYLAGLGLNLYSADTIYKAMIKESRYPDGLFRGSPETIGALRGRIESALGSSRPVS
jgi:spermidine synthase